MSIIRVGFVLGGSGWLGGTNYYRNLFTAIQSLPNPKVQPVIFAGLTSDVSAFEELAEIVRTPILERQSFQWWMRHLLSKAFPWRDYVLYRTLRTHRIDQLFSQFGLLWKGCSISTIGWIPDFQHLHLPEYFDKNECAARNEQFTQLIGSCDALLLSSQDALNDLRIFCPDSITPTYVLRFVSCLYSNSGDLPTRAELISKYKLDRPWFHIPNQFWAHKNHGVVLDALHSLQLLGGPPLVIATGDTTDYRMAGQGHFLSLMQRMNDCGLQNDFRVLGVLPYSDVLALMQHSVAVINPSLFEGWSTSVEEAKAMGKKSILSDIAVHREQSPELGYYFEPNDHLALARHMTAILQQFHEVDGIACQQENIKKIETTQDFARQYEAIVLQVFAGKKGERFK